MSKLVVFDKQKVFNDEIKPILDELKDTCVRCDIPFFTVFATENTDDRTLYKMDGMFPGVQDIKLTDDKIAYLYKYMTGYLQPEELHDDELNDVLDDFPDSL